MIPHSDIAIASRLFAERPAFGRFASAHAEGESHDDGRGSIDAITAELRQRILTARETRVALQLRLAR
jgi:hypothetical protein